MLVLNAVVKYIYIYIYIYIHIYIYIYAHDPPCMLDIH